VKHHGKINEEAEGAAEKQQEQRDSHLPRSASGRGTDGGMRSLES
jgi:hypothetical protein